MKGLDRFLEFRVAPESVLHSNCQVHKSFVAMSPNDRYDIVNLGSNQRNFNDQGFLVRYLLVSRLWR